MSIVGYTTAEFKLTGQQITTTAAELMVDRTKGVYRVFFDPDEIWSRYDGKMTAVFKPAFGQKVEAEVIDFETEIPAEAIRAPWVKIGVYYKDGGVIYPTVFSSRLAVEPGAAYV